jgi:DNA-binding LytR/AlgR family response regulator
LLNLNCRFYFRPPYYSGGVKMEYRVIIADDDEPICKLLCDMLGSFEGFSIIGQVSSGLELLDIIKIKDPNVVFLDIKMTVLDSISITKQLKKDSPDLYVIFISSYTNYAAESFYLDAVDYLVKPITRERLRLAIAKLKRYKNLQPTAKRIKKSMGFRLRKLCINNGHGLVIIDQEQIVFIEKIGKKCFIHTRKEIFETNESLSNIQTQLNLNFFRCHKSFIINIEEVKKVMPYGDRTYEIIFNDYQGKATMRRKKFEEFCLIMKS